MRSLAARYLDKQIVFKLMVLIIIQQLITAVGTFALARAGLAIGDASAFLYWVFAALIAHLAAPIFGLIIRPIEISLTFAAYKKFLVEKLVSKSGRPSIWAQKERREIFLASVGAETDSYLAAIILVGLDLFSYALSIVLGILVIGFVIDPKLIPAFILSGLLSFAAYRLMEGRVKLASTADQAARTDLAGTILKAWENAFFKNDSTI